MNTQELRSVIWDDLFRARTSKSLRELAALHGTDVDSIVATVDHAWFQVTDQQVAIAMATPGQL